ncbi:LPS export ABC transporter permease LptG [Biformimicrobium ophioploci]|uniref:LPS export ABC transporter permease LptG n=1 Tax=Biformimicrobium ophioploci TaxID=3036711 RepID=A0ABQ6LXD9_9GAMM|nr:LPS export ABC transporter permease LptG [Microbulbifer sp. NKW57]GMG86740.1 LPS export ABC transporter permease LptG [Microbulbifer sp. NKW57]
MHKLDGYIGRTVAASVIGVLLVFLGLMVIAALIDEKESVSGDYTMGKAVVYVLWTLPARINELLPMAALVGCMVGLGSLASTSELTIMRAAGISIGRLAWSVLKPLLLFIILGAALSEFVIPHTNQQAESRKAHLLGELEAEGLEKGLWLRDGEEFVHFNAALPGGTLFGITRYAFDENRQLKQVAFSERGSFHKEGWQLENTRISRMSADAVTNDVSFRENWETEVTPNLFALIAPHPGDLSMSNLWSYANFLEKKEDDASRYWLEFWKKALQPLAIASLVLVAISFVFGPLREVTMGLRVFTGVIVGIIFQTTQNMLGPSSLVFGFSPLIAVLVPILLCFGLGWALLRRAR